MPRSKLRTPELKQRLRDAAIEVLTREGPDGVTTRTVARAAETSTPAVYELFGDKAGLVREVFFEGFRVLRTQLGATAGPTIRWPTCGPSESPTARSSPSTPSSRG